MTVPREYRDASRDFERFLIAARDSLGCETTHRAYATVRAVLMVFRRHLSPRDALRFASALPPLIRALFVGDWDLDPGPVPPFGERDSLTREVLAVRTDHNVAPVDAIAAVARALRDHLGGNGLECALDPLPSQARAYWQAEA